MNLIKQVTAAFPSADAFFKWIDYAIDTVEELDNNDAVVKDKYTIVTPLPVPPKKHLLILPDEDIKDDTFPYLWALDLQPTSELYIPIHLIPKHGSHIKLPGYNNVFLVALEDVAMTHTASTDKWKKYW
jgi:hypothetical protein